MSNNVINDKAPALSVSNLTHHFGKLCALEDATLQVFPGDFTVLLGLNGAGKTTLYSLITRLYNNRSGSIKIFDFDLHKQSSRALSKIGVVFQQATLDLDLTVAQNLYYYASLHGLSNKLAGERMKEELSRMKILDQLKKKIRELSGGLRRRVEIARALLHKPEMLLLDEPTVGLDVSSRQAILDHVRNLCHKDRLAVLWATHLIDEIDEGEKVVILHDGEVLASGFVEEINKKVNTSNIRDAFNLIIKSGKKI